MRAKPLLNHILDNEALTRSLGDAEARVLVEWLVEQAEGLARTAAPEEATREVLRLCRRGRGIARFVSLWSHERRRGAAGQLAVTEGFTWPFPDAEVDPCELMQAIVGWEARDLRSRPPRPAA
jgi:hypothetical protein